MKTMTQKIIKIMMWKQMIKFKTNKNQILMIFKSMNQTIQKSMKVKLILILMKLNRIKTKKNNKK